MLWYVLLLVLLFPMVDCSTPLDPIKTNPDMLGALNFAIATTYYRGSVTWYSSMTIEEQEVPGNGVKYIIYSEIILGLTPCYVDYYEVWKRETPAGYVLLDQKKTNNKCRQKAYVANVLKATNCKKYICIYMLLFVCTFILSF